MTDFDPHDPEPALAHLAALVGEDPRLAAELRATAATFRVGAAPPEGSPEDLQAQRRHLEWFLFERVDPELDGVPAERLMPDWLERCEGPARDLAEGLLGSLAGIFEVTSAEPGRGVWARDLFGGGEYPLSEPGAAGELAPRDLLVGRVFPVGAELFRLSPAAGVFRNGDLRKALHRDVENLRASRRGSLRVSQIELERMFFAGPSPEAPDPAEAQRAAAEILAAGGLAPEDAVAAVTAVVARPFDPEALVHGAGDVLGEVLDTLAFESEVDLEAARQALWTAWSATAVARDAAPLTTEPGAQLGAQSGAQSGARRAAGDAPMDPSEALASFDRGRSEGGDLDALFDQLERDLGLTTGGSTEGADATPDFPGVVGAMLAEYRWDLERTSDVERLGAARLLGGLAEYTEDLGVFENLGRTQLLGFCALWVPEREAVADADEAAELLDALADFCRWCEREHELELWSAFREDWEALRQDLPRALETRPDWREAEGRTELLEVRGGALVPLGDETPAEDAPREWGERLGEGFVLRRGGGAVERVFPPAARELLQGA